MREGIKQGSVSKIATYLLNRAAVACSAQPGCTIYAGQSDLATSWPSATYTDSKASGSPMPARDSQDIQLTAKAEVPCKVAALQMPPRFNIEAELPSQGHPTLATAAKCWTANSHIHQILPASVNCSQLKAEPTFRGHLTARLDGVPYKTRAALSQRPFASVPQRLAVPASALPPRMQLKTRPAIQLLLAVATAESWVYMQNTTRITAVPPTSTSDSTSCGKLFLNNHS